MRILPRGRLMAASVFAVAAASAGLGTVAPAMAHHSFAMYTQQYKFSYVGAVVSIIPEFNHQVMSFVVLNAERNDFARRAPTAEQTAAGQPGSPIVMNVEMAGSAQAANQGIVERNFPPGTVISLSFYPLRSTVNENPLTDAENISGGGDIIGPIIRCPQNPARNNTWTLIPGPGQFCQDLEGSEMFGAAFGETWAGAVEWIVAATSPDGIAPVASQGEAGGFVSQNF